MAINNKAISLSAVAAIVAFSWLNLCEGYKFYVGGRDGWVIKPSEDYNHWAERNRFQINDTLLFKYKKGEDSVLVVTRDNYARCYTAAPLENLTGGETEFRFSRSGPHYFISGKGDNCKQGQRLIVVVLAVRPPRGTPPSPAQPPAPVPEAEVAPESGTGVSHLGPALAPKSNLAAKSVGGSLGLVGFCLGVLGATVLMSN
ncbi:hypothetical protein V2J09_002621 [Rumex salicifolius]